MRIADLGVEVFGVEGHEPMPLHEWWASLRPGDVLLLMTEEEGYLDGWEYVESETDGEGLTLHGHFRVHMTPDEIIEVPDQAQLWRLVLNPLTRDAVVVVSMTIHEVQA